MGGVLRRPVCICFFCSFHKGSRTEPPSLSSQQNWAGPGRPRHSFGRRCQPFVVVLVGALRSSCRASRNFSGTRTRSCVSKCCNKRILFIRLPIIRGGGDNGSLAIFFFRNISHPSYLGSTSRLRNCLAQIFAVTCGPLFTIDSRTKGRCNASLTYAGHFSASGASTVIAKPNIVSQHFQPHTWILNDLLSVIFLFSFAA